MTQLTSHEIHKFVGPLNDDRVAAILATGATADDVLDAFTWLTSDEYHGGKLVRPQSGAVTEVYEILKSDEPEVEEDRPR